MKNSHAPESQPICIVCGSDEAFSRPLAVALYSTFKHLRPGQKVTLYLIDGGLSSKSRSRLQRVVSRMSPATAIHFIAPEPHQMHYLQGARHISVATYLRLFIPELLPAEIDRVLYLDCDILVQSDVSELYHGGTAGCAVAATRDYAVATVSHPFSGVKDWQKLGIAPDSPSFNAGILLLDLRVWREQQIAAKVVEYAVQHAGTLGNCDQDALNAILAFNWHRVDERWNVQYALFYVQELPLHDAATAEFYALLGRERPRLWREAKIFHFTGTPKPWDHWCTHPAITRWALALLRSGWYSPREAALWLMPWGLKFLWSRLKSKLKRAPRRESIESYVSPAITP